MVGGVAQCVQAVWQRGQGAAGCAGVVCMQVGVPAGCACNELHNLCGLQGRTLGSTGYGVGMRAGKQLHCAAGALDGCAYQGF